ncbi:LuxR C-terminal-related transcriptional regulator, partial [Pseudorhodoplanes sp.]|uniref:LuxR C-terminal-related transcriptional regulator n=1 Tax=Pseudorhodoplanes sp. TaxID=1934341 RepID=UPI002B65E9A0
RWPDTCRKIADLCESTGGGICVHDLRHTQNDQLFVFGYQAEFLKRLGAHYAQSPMATADVVADIGDVKALSMERQREMSLFTLVAPHVCRALTISDALDIRALRSEMLERTLDGLAAGVFLTARDGRVVYMNAAAERQVKTGKSIRIVNERISPTDPGARAALSKAIEKASRDDSDTDTDLREYSLAIPDAGGAGVVATLLPVDRGRRCDVVAGHSASVAVFTKDPEETSLMPGEAFARLYGLTGGELRVLIALGQGMGAKEAADMLGISEPTVRTHLQRMFSKTETTRQTDLLRLLQNATPPIQHKASQFSRSLTA